ncbi:MAG: aminoglycoside adenylyltransferase domain-containing protein [Candidatus Limnocylindria bacterium]
MAGVPLNEVPVSAQRAWLELRDELRRILRDDLIAMWAHGGTVAVGDPPHAADLDTYVVVSRLPDEAIARAIEDAHDAIAAEQGVEWDAWYVRAEDARGVDPPSHAWHEGRRDTSWAIHRAHWLGGRFVNLHGPEPSELVKAPAWEELTRELGRELEHIERHVVEGDTDPFEATYAILNGSRILHAVETGSVVISKRAAGTWALGHLPVRWHAALEAAMRAHDGRAAAGDEARLAKEMAPFVAFVKERTPDIEHAPADALPRWSGS